MPLPYDPTTNFKDSNGVDLGKKLITQDYVATVYPSLSQSAAGFVASPAELYISGSNGYGQIGDNTTASRSTPRQEFTSATNWKEISSRGDHTLAIKTDGTLWAWGSNGYGQVGDGSNTNRSTPRQISIAAAGGLTGWKTVSSGQQTSLAIREDGTLWAWGRNLEGQIGDNTKTTRFTPRQISISAAGGVTGWKSCAASWYHAAAIRTDGTLWLWGYNYGGQLGDNSSTVSGLRSTPKQEFTSSTNWKQVSMSNDVTVAVKNDGTLWCWGLNSQGQVGDNSNVTGRSTPRQISAGASGVTGWKQVSGGSFHVVALRTDGTLFGWGRNLYGELGDNTTPGGSVFRSTPKQEFTGSTNWKQVSAGNDITTAIKTDGTLWSWGRNDVGQLGDNTSGTTHRSTPRQISISGVGGVNGWRAVSGKNGVAAIKFPIGQ